MAWGGRPGRGSGVRVGFWGAVKDKLANGLDSPPKDTGGAFDNSANESPMTPVNRMGDTGNDPLDTPATGDEE